MFFHGCTLDCKTLRKFAFLGQKKIDIRKKKTWTDPISLIRAEPLPLGPVWKHFYQP